MGRELSDLYLGQTEGWRVGRVLVDAVPRWEPEGTAAVWTYDPQEHPREDVRELLWIVSAFAPARPGSSTPVRWPHFARFEAVCPRGNPPPCDYPCMGAGDGCGIYAYKQRSELDRLGEPQEQLGVIMRIALWGRVWEHERGWRAQYAYPLAFESLYSNKHTWREDVIARLRAAYGID